MYAGLPFTVTLTPSSEVGIWPEANDDALLQVSPLAALDGARLAP
jgi:hypothetical protein